MESKSIGDKIIQARKKLNLSQAQLADQLFISPQAVGKWERGESTPDIITVNKLARVLKVDLNYFSNDFQSIPESSGQQVVVDQEPTIPVLHKPNWNLSKWNWVDADFSGLEGLREKISATNMKKCLFIDTDLSGLPLNKNNVQQCDFRGSNLESCEISYSNLVNNLFNDCNLQKAFMTGCHISKCDFSGADFSGANIKHSAFSENEVSGSILIGFSISKSKLAETTFDGILKDCYFEHCGFSKVKFENATFINTCFKVKNLKRTKFINCKADKISYEFLKHCKADLSDVSII